MTVLTKDDILRFAAESGFVVDELSKEHQPNCIYHTSYMIDEQLQRFAELVVQFAIQHEREECAKICYSLSSEFMDLDDQFDAQYGTENSDYYYGKSIGAHDCGDAIQQL